VIPGNSIAAPSVAFCSESDEASHSSAVRTHCARHDDESSLSLHRYFIGKAYLRAEENFI